MKRYYKIQIACLVSVINEHLRDVYHLINHGCLTWQVSHQVPIALSAVIHLSVVGSWSSFSSCTLIFTWNGTCVLHVRKGL